MSSCGNSFRYSNKTIDDLKAKAFSTLTNVDTPLKALNSRLLAILADDENMDSEIEKFLADINYQSLVNTPEFEAVKNILIQIMNLVSEELEANWDDPRYAREVED